MWFVSARVLRWWGRAILFLELFYFVFWFASMFAVIAYEEDPPVGPLVVGLPLSVYDGMAEYRLSHFKLFAHFFSPAATFQLLTGLGSTGDITPWFWLIIAMVIGTDTFSTMENYKHLSPVEHPDFYNLEVILSISALSLSVVVLIWFTATYIRHHTKQQQQPLSPGSEPLLAIKPSGFSLVTGHAVGDAMANKKDF
jgi:hypothetical protein